MRGWPGRFWSVFYNASSPRLLHWHLPRSPLQHFGVIAVLGAGGGSIYFFIMDIRSKLVRRRRYLIVPADFCSGWLYTRAHRARDLRAASRTIECRPLQAHLSDLTLYIGWHHEPSTASLGPNSESSVCADAATQEWDGAHPVRFLGRTAGLMLALCRPDRSLYGPSINHLRSV